MEGGKGYHNFCMSFSSPKILVYVFILVKDINGSRHPNAAVAPLLLLFALATNQVLQFFLHFVVQEVLPCSLNENQESYVHSYRRARIIYSNTRKQSIYWARPVVPRILPLPVFVCLVSDYEKLAPSVTVRLMEMYN